MVFVRNENQVSGSRQGNSPLAREGKIIASLLYLLKVTVPEILSDILGEGEDDGFKMEPLHEGRVARR